MWIDIALLYSLVDQKWKLILKSMTIILNNKKQEINMLLILYQLFILVLNYEQLISEITFDIKKKNSFHFLDIWNIERNYYNSFNLVWF